ncbi:hypothetical protein ID866_533 [Astraeus odoratus]|nr:hypothetical protein ID866_533 [Astraeus odoratus]
MERVQFQQEQMLAELRDLVQKGLFTQVEVKQIMKKRTQFETALVRRIAKKGDFLRYAAYEMGLEQLRRKRLQRLNLPKTKATISDYALVRRQFHILERALRRFKADVGLWTQYIQVAKRAGARSLVGRITARALQLHPNVPSLYIIAASHELSHTSPSAARSLLQRGLRLNADSIDLWREYVRMELHFIEGMRRRWNVLGIPVEEEKKKSIDDGQMDIDIDIGDTGNPVFINDDQEQKPPDEVVTAEQGGDAGEAARKAIMEGAIVKSAMSSAAKGMLYLNFVHSNCSHAELEALPRIDLFTQLENLIRTYPCQPQLRTILLDELYFLLQQAVPHDPQAIKMQATRRLRELTSEKAKDGALSEKERLVDSLQYANEQLMNAVNHGPVHGSRVEISAIYADFVKEWCQLPTLDATLKQYLTSSLHVLAQRLDASPILRATYLRIQLCDSVPSKKIVKLARRYSLSTDSPEVWLARLDIEKIVNEDDIKSTWSLARSAVHDCQNKDGVEKVWLWGLDHLTNLYENREALFENLLKQSMENPSDRSIHQTLLLRYVSDVVYAECSDSANRHNLIRKIPIAYMPTKTVWESLFSHESAYQQDAMRLEDGLPADQVSDSYAQVPFLGVYRGADALSMVEQAIIELEDDENLNAGMPSYFSFTSLQIVGIGTGSNLTLDGVVECDAAIMDGITSDFGSIGAVPGVKNPIRLASTVLRHSRKPDVLGRIRPLTLVSNGAHEFARRNGVETVPPESMISPQAARDWQKWVERYKDAREGVVSEVDPLPDDVMQDTVGAVGLDSFGNMAAGVSRTYSGGLLLKCSGRVGEVSDDSAGSRKSNQLSQAAVFGAGCWAQLSSDGRTGLACSISGVGEHIIQAGLARAIGDAYWSSERIERQGHGQVDVHELLVSILTERFYRPASDRGTARPNAGVLLLTREAQEDGSAIPLLWCDDPSASPECKQI